MGNVKKKAADEPLTPEEAAPMLRKSIRSITGYCQTGQIRADRVGHNWLISLKEIAYIRKNDLRPKKKAAA